MHKFSIAIIVLLFTVTASAQDKSLPDITELMKSVSNNQAKVKILLENYSYIQEDKELEKDDKGNTTVKSSKTYFMIFYKGNRIQRLIAENGKPISAKDDDGETKKIEKRIKKIDEGKSGTGFHTTISDILRVTTTYNPRIEQYNNRECIVFNFKPNPKIKPKADTEKLAYKMAGAIWIDPEDKQVAKVEARFIKSFKVAGGLLVSIKEGSTILVEQTRINNEVWLPSKTEIQLPIKVFLVKTINVNRIITYSEYKRFNVESEKEKLIDPPIQQF